MKPIFKRSEHNPILSVSDLPFYGETVLNPGAADTCVYLAVVRLGSNSGCIGNRFRPI